MYKEKVDNCNKIYVFYDVLVFGYVIEAITLCAKVLSCLKWNDYLVIEMIWLNQRKCCALYWRLNHIFSPLHLGKKIFLSFTFENDLFNPLQM